MDWYRADANLKAHWKLALLCQKLKIEIRDGVGLLHLLWEYVCSYADDGELVENKQIAIASYLDWPIDRAGELVDALIEAGFIDQTEDGIEVHNWKSRNKRIFEQREYQKSYREKQKGLREHNDNISLANRKQTKGSRRANVSDTYRQTDIHTNSKKKNPPTAGTSEPDKSAKRSSDSNAKVEIEAFVEAWNSIKSFSTCRTVTDSRIKALRTRLKDSFWRENWRAALRRVSGNSFLSGKNDRGWKATVEWFLKPDTVAQIMEGQCDNWGENNKSSKPESKPQPSKWDDPKWHTRQANIRKVWDRQKREAAAKGKPEPKPPQGYDPKWKPKGAAESIDEDGPLPF